MNKNHTSKTNLETFEGMLEGTFQHVSPRPEFVRKLKQQLIGYPRPSVETSKINSLEYILIALVSLAGGTLFLVTGARAVLSLLGALGVVHFLKKQQDEKKNFSGSRSISPV